MPVSLFTGLPGSGKTATLVKRILELQKKEPGRPIFQFGITGLKPGLAATLTQEQLEHWWDELPQGSIVCIDECQEDGTNPDQPVCLMPKDRGAPSAWVQRLTKVRHYGMDFLLTTQHPANMSAYVRRLVDYHCHSVMRSRGVRQTYVWQRCIDDPDNRREKKTAEMSFSPLPKEVFDLYKSSSLHTMKVRIPRVFYFVAAGALFALFLAFYIPHRMHAAMHPKPLAAASAAATAAMASEGLRSTDFVKWSTPRVPGLPWTAPMFDKLTVQAQPRLYCMALETGVCKCISEQGTSVDVPLAMCHKIVTDGVYNPFVPPLGSDKDEKKEASARRPATSSPAARMPSSSDESAVAAAVPVDAGGTSGGRSRATATNYVPPTYGPGLPDEGLQMPAAHQ